MDRINERRAEPMSVWLMVLCGLLLAWEPVRFGLVASNALPALSYRGGPLALLLAARVVSTALGVAAGLALVSRRGSAVAMAKAALTLAAVLDVITYTTPSMPSTRMPGDAPLYVVVSLAYYGIWLAYLSRSKRVRRMYA